MSLRVAGCILACLLFVPVARAEWVEVSSDHFVIYGDDNPKSIRAFAERLELFDAAMAQVFVRKRANPSPSNRVTIYVVDDEVAVREITHMNPASTVAGIYRPRAGASVAYVPKLRQASRTYELSGETILYHEYAHHFMWSLTARAYPRWFTEGFAEFFAGVRFWPDTVALGTPAAYRQVDVASREPIPIRGLLEFDGGTGDKPADQDMFYGQSWALFHYLEFAPERSGQLARYQQLLATGGTAREAAEGAFGDLDQLAQDVLAYRTQSSLKYWKIGRKTLEIGPMSLRTLSRGEAAMMSTHIRSRAGVDKAQALALLPQARQVAAQFPDDAAVQAVLAEAECDAQNDDAAIRAADRAIALDSRRVDAYLQKGYALFHKAESAGNQDAWKAVRAQFIKANAIEHDHPLALVEFYQTYLAQGIEPTRNAVEGMEWALSLAPFDASLRWMAVNQMVRDHRLSDAARTLAPLAYGAHPGEFTDRARKLLDKIQTQVATSETNATAVP
jgi:tetratricopeptide (TPR) repeat protein